MRSPSVLVPYPGPGTADGAQDVAVYLRPESNGVRVESAILRELRASPERRERIELVYLANIPGDVLAARGVVAAHYACRVVFARAGARAFTPGMRERFERAFGVPFDVSDVVGAWEAMRATGLDAEQLFELRVPQEEVATILGQNVKHYGGRYIVNYDIPALLGRHDASTDVFSMLLRSRASHAEIVELMGAVEGSLRAASVVAESTSMSRVLHHSRGPFEQILDGLGYLYAADGSPIPLSELSFARYLMDTGVEESTILRAVRCPIVRLARGDAVEEVELFEHTRGDSYAAAAAKLRCVREWIQLPRDEAEGPYTPR